MERDDIWKAHCLRFWKERGLQQRNFDLEWAKKESQKDWIFFARCFAKESATHCYTYYESNSRVYIGERGLETLEGEGIALSPLHIHVGTFSVDIVQGLWAKKGGDRYIGGWEAGKMHGKGCYIWEDGTKFDGEYLHGKRQGVGCVTYPDGLKIETTWVQSQPEDKELSVHPKVKECIKDFVCTRRVTGNTDDIPQFVMFCKVCESQYCKVCWERCHKGDHSFSEVWFIGTHCHCKLCN